MLSREAPASRGQVMPACVYVEPNDVAGLRAAFAQCDAEDMFVEAVLLVGTPRFCSPHNMMPIK